MIKISSPALLWGNETCRKAAHQVPGLRMITEFECQNSVGCVVRFLRKSISA
jgi:hypothetical protein